MLDPFDLDAPATRLVLGRDLGAFGERTALVTADGEIPYADLAVRVERAAHSLSETRRLVMVAGANTVDAVVGYLGALAAGHVVLLVPDEETVIESLTQAYNPDVVCRAADGVWRQLERRPGSAHQLHPDLALLLSTSGSTGSPKLVRLSYENLRVNAESIASYLGVRDTDRAAITLPLHYCYGLSVLHSSLIRGAGIILTGLSVADACFWKLFRDARGTSIAGVPYTFTLLDRVGFDAMELPHLRYVTQAGGRMAPEVVRRYAELGHRRGFDLFVMYGQTEATARMAYLPPDQALTHPSTIGVPVPGGALRLAPVEEAHGFDDVGELVYSGPNVMLGYAEQPADLALGRTVQELFTGDLARRTDEGLFEIVGRRSRFAKLFGIRIDLQHVETGLEADGVRACCVAGDDELVVAIEQAERRAEVRRLVAASCRLPARAVRVLVFPELPRLASGKVDLKAVAARASEPAPAASTATDGADLRALYAEILDRSDVDDDSTFVGLGGDSLSYVEMSVRLEQILGVLPVSWHTMPIRQLRACAAEPTPRRRRTLDTGVALRAVAIVLIVGTHADLFTVRGGAHLLLALAGFNFARFHLTDAPRQQRTRHLAASVARIAVPSSLYLALVALLDHKYSWQNALLLNEAIGPRVGPQRHYWFVETVVYLLVGLAAVLAIRRVDRWERRWPFLLPVVLLGAGLAVRYDLLALSPLDRLATPARLFWFFALGWAIAKAGAPWQRMMITGVGAVAVVGYFGNPLREGFIVVGLLLLTWAPRLPSLSRVNRVAAVLASSSLYIYLVHWQVYPPLQRLSPLLATLASVVAGVVLGVVVARSAHWLGEFRSRHRAPAAPRRTRRAHAD